MYADELGGIRSRGGICSERPRGAKAGRRGVVRGSAIAQSSFDFRLSTSLNFGDGDNVGGPPSDDERGLDGDCEVALLSDSLSLSTPLSSTDSILARIFSLNLLLNMLADYSMMDRLVRSTWSQGALSSVIPSGVTSRRVRDSSSRGRSLSEQEYSVSILGGIV